VLVFLLDGAGLDAVNVAAAGFLLDASDRVIGTAGGTGQVGASLNCSQPREFRVNTQTAGTQGAPALCQTPAGDTIVAWAGPGIAAQRYSSAGVALGGEIAVNTSASGTQSQPAICCRTDSGFVVAWGDSAGDGGVFARRYASDAKPLGDQFPVNTSNSGAHDPTITCLPDGGFFAAWLTNLGPDANGIDAQYFTAAGAPSGDEFHIEHIIVPPGFPPGPQLFSPSACSGPGGNVVVAWFSNLNSEHKIEWQQYASDRSLQDAGDTGHDDQHAHFHPAVACRPDGSYALVDQVTTPCNVVPPFMCGADGSGDGIFFIGAGGLMKVNSSTLGNQDSPAIATDGNGDALVIWTSDTKDGGQAGIFGQRFTSAGTPLGSEFQLNANPGGTQSEPAVSCDANGHCVAAWTAPDDSDTGVFAHRVPNSGN
jgi:hypothetical protein